MSNKISYVLEVLDGFTKNTRKLKKELGTLEAFADSLNTKLNKNSPLYKNKGFLEFSQAIRQTDSLKRSIDGLNRSSQQSVNIAQQHARVLSANLTNILLIKLS